jgi:CheY-like chemotaxis protein
MSDTSPPNVLVVDDDETVAITTARVLRLQGYVVRTQVSAEAGLSDADTAPPDAIIVDFRMPVIDGLEFLRRLRIHPRLGATPVAIVTGGHLPDEVTAEIQSLGAEIWFKPLWRTELLRLVSGLVHGEAFSAERSDGGGR